MNSSNVLKPAYRLALFVVAVLGIGTVVCYRERVLFVDPAWIVFNALNSGRFVIAEHRWGAFITQMVPLIGGKLGVPLRGILIAYSVSFYLFYGSVVWLAGRRFAEPRLAILLLLYLTLFATDSYYWPNNEVHQGTAWGILFLAAFFRGGSPTKRSFWGHLFLVSTLLLALSSHLLVGLPLSFLWVYRQWRKAPSVRGLLRQKETVFYTLLMGAGLLGRYALSRNSWYDGNALQSVKTLSLKSFLGAFSTAQSKSFGALFATHYWLLVPLIVIGFGPLLRRRQFFLVSITLLWATLYYGLVCTVFKDAITPASRFYFESEWLGLSLILATPFVMEGPTFLKSPKLFAGILAVVFAFRTADMAHSYFRFHQRYKALAQTTERLYKAGISKAIVVVPKETGEARFLMPWGLPVESLMISELEGYVPAVSFKIEETVPLQSPPADSFLSCFGTVPVSSLNRRYFHPDTTTGYRFLDGAALLQ